MGGGDLPTQLVTADTWPTSYVWNGKKQHTTAKSSTFSRLADKPGSFAITSVAHQQNQVCQVVLYGIIKVR